MNFPRLTRMSALGLGMVIWAGASATEKVVCSKSYGDFYLGNIYMTNFAPEGSLKLGDMTASEYVIEFDTDSKVIQKITATNKAPEVVIVFTPENSSMTHQLIEFKEEERDQEFCADNPCREHYEYIKAELKNPSGYEGALSSLEIQIDRDVIYPDIVSSRSVFKVGPYALSEMADQTSCDGTILLKRMTIEETLEEGLLE